MDGVANDGPVVGHYSDSIIASLTNAALVIECLGQDAVDDLMAELVQNQLLSYDKMGREGGALFKLEKETFERRWVGLRRLLYAADARMKDICPSAWMLPHRLYLEFCERTARHLRSLLTSDYNRYRTAAVTGVDPNLANQSNFNVLSTTIGLQETQDHVGRIVNTLKSVLSIEEEMNNRFEDDTLSLHAQSKTEEDVLAKLTQGSLISYVFEDFMTPYVQLERKSLDDTVRGLIAQDDESNATLGNTIANASQTMTASKGTSGSTKTNITEELSAEILATAAQTTYDSSGRLFETIRQSMRRCLALTNGRPFLLLVNEYRGCIQMYSESLIAKFPQVDYPPSSKSLVSNVSGNKAPPYRMPMEDEIIICRVISTAEYCADVTPKLETQIKSKINVTLEKDIDFTPQCDQFTDVVAEAIGLLVKGVMSHTEAAIKIMKKISWGSISNVVDDSPYVPVIKTILTDCIPRIRHALTSIWFKNFCTRFVTDFLDQYLAIIVNQKKICQLGAEQLLLDTNSLKTIFTSLHHLNLPSERKSEYIIPTTYTSLVGNRLKHIETILKLICTPDDQFEEMFAIMWPEGEVGDMQMILDLKHSNSSVMSSTVGAIGDLSAATTRVTVGAVADGTRGVVDGTKSAFGATKNAFGATKNAIGAVGSSSKAFGGSMSKTFSAIKITQSLKNVTKNLHGDENEARDR
jgi:vacuolar protein sorting-associated protein 53